MATLSKNPYGQSYMSKIQLNLFRLNKIYLMFSPNSKSTVFCSLNFNIEMHHLSKIGLVNYLKQNREDKGFYNYFLVALIILASVF